MAIVNELVTSLNFKLGPKALETINTVTESIKSLSKNVQSMANVGASALKKLKDEAVEVANQMQKIERFSTTSGISKENIQRWTYAANINKLSPAAILSDVEKITQKMGGEKGLIDIMNKLSTASEVAAKEMIEKYQISRDFLDLVKAEGGTDGVFKRLEEMPLVVSDQDVKNSAELARNFEKMNQTLQKMKEKFLTGLSEPLNKQLENIDAFLKKHNYFQEEIEYASETVGKGITNAFQIADELMESLFEGRMPDAKKISDMFGKDDTTDTVTMTAVLGILTTVGRIALGLTPLIKLMAIAKIVDEIYKFITKSPTGYIEEYENKLKNKKLTAMDWAVSPIWGTAREFGRAYEGAGNVLWAATNNPGLNSMELAGIQAKRIMDARKTTNTTNNVTTNNTYNMTVNPATPAASESFLNSIGIKTPIIGNGFATGNQ